MEPYPGNSRTHKTQPKSQDEKKVSKVISGEPILRKKSLGRRFRETFLTGEDAQSVFIYLFAEVFVPAAKDTISDMVTQGVDRALYGESRGRPPRSRTVGSQISNSVISYNRISTGNRREDPRRPVRDQKRAIHSIDDIVLETRIEAQEVLDNMVEIVANYDSASVADLYELCGFSGPYTNEKWGWTDLRGARLARVRDGYLLDLPKPELLD